MMDRKQGKMDASLGLFRDHNHVPLLKKKLMRVVLINDLNTSQKIFSYHSSSLIINIVTIKKIEECLKKKISLLVTKSLGVLLVVMM